MNSTTCWSYWVKHAVNVEKARYSKLETTWKQIKYPSPSGLCMGRCEELYLGSTVEQSGKVDKEMAIKIKKAGTMYHIWRREVFRSQNLSKATKM